MEEFPMLTKPKGALFLVVTALILSLGLVAFKIPGAHQGGRPLRATLAGSAEVPGPADPDGSGKAVITFNPGQNMICWKITVSDITLPATGAHIHKAKAGVAGPIVVPLSPPDASGKSSGCTSATRAEIKDIMHHVNEYYVNVHTTDYPAGALRGQLKKK